MKAINTPAETNIILITYASAGKGHQSAARSLQESLKNDYSINADLVDILDHCSGLMRFSYRHFYRFLVCSYPRVYRYFYNLLDNPHTLLVRFSRKYIEPLETRQYQHLLRDTKPALVISTHFLSTSVTSLIKQQGNWSGQLWQVVTDFQSHGLHIAPQIDHFFVPSMGAKNNLSNWGITDESISVTGIPCSESFYQLHKARFTESKRNPANILFLGHGAPFKKVTHFLKQFIPNKSLRLTIAGIKGADKRDKLLSMLKEKGLDIPVLGHINTLPELLSRTDLLICKAGGLITSEAMNAGVPLAIYYHYLGQETLNLEYLIDKGVARKIECFQEVVDLVDDKNKLNCMRQALKVTASPMAAQQIAKAAALSIQASK